MLITAWTIVSVQQIVGSVISISDGNGALNIAQEGLVSIIELSGLVKLEYTMEEILENS